MPLNRMAKRGWALALLPLGLALTQATLAAASLVVTNNCSVGPGNGDGVSAVVTTGPCNVNVAVPNGGYPNLHPPATAYANANTTAVWTVPAGPSGPVTLTIKPTGTIGGSFELVPTQPYPTEYDYNASATTTFNFNAVLDSGGPIRSGFLTVSSTGAISDSYGAPYSYGYNTLSMNVPGSPYPLNWYGTADLGSGESFPPAALPLPITLGEAFSVTASGQFTANQSGFSGGASGIVAPPLTLQFEFFEADGSTPVAVTDVTPEPGTWGFVAGGLGFYLLRGRSVRLLLSRW